MFLWCTCSYLINCRKIIIVPLIETIFLSLCKYLSLCILVLNKRCFNNYIFNKQIFTKYYSKIEV